MGETCLRGRAEPPLEEMLRDPIVLALMRCDRVSPAEMQRLIEAARAKLAAVRRQRAEPCLEPA